MHKITRDVILLDLPADIHWWSQFMPLQPRIPRSSQHILTHAEQEEDGVC